MTTRTNNRAGPIITSAGLNSEEIHRPRRDTAGERGRANVRHATPRLPVGCQGRESQRKVL